MIRWTYLIPRVIIVGLIVLAVWVGSDPLIRLGMVQGLQNRTGAKVEIAQLRFSLANQKIFLKDIAMADPLSPMSNLFQADMAYIEFDKESLWRRKIIIDHSQASGVRFGASRTVHGALDEFPPTAAPTMTPWESKTVQDIEDIGRRWVDRFPVATTESITLNQLEIVQAIQTIEQFWRGQLQTRELEIAEIRKTRAELSNLTNRVNENPLRPTLINSEAKIELIAQKSKAVQVRLNELLRSAESHRQSLKMAHNRDFQKLRQSNKVASFDSDSVSELLLAEAQAEYVGEVLSWFHWFRNAIPNPETSFQAKKHRGINVPIGGIEPTPDFLIRALDLEGEGRIANRHIDFAGTAYNLTPSPGLHSQPASFELHAQGDQHLIVSCTIDRRKGDEIDKLNIICPDLELDGRLLGEPNSLLVTLGPASRIQADIQIQTINGELSGELIFRHSNVSLHVDKLNELAGGEDTALRMNQGLAVVDQFRTRVTLSGTLEDYQYEFQSDLGSRFSNAVNALLIENGENRIAKQKQALDEMLSQQIAKLDQRILPEIKRLSNLLDAESTEIASLRDSIPKSSIRPSKIR